MVMKLKNETYRGWNIEITREKNQYSREHEFEYHARITKNDKVGKYYTKVEDSKEDFINMIKERIDIAENSQVEISTNNDYLGKRSGGTREAIFSNIYKGFRFHLKNEDGMWHVWGGPEADISVSKLLQKKPIRKQTKEEAIAEFKKAVDIEEEYMKKQGFNFIPENRSFNSNW